MKRVLRALMGSALCLGLASAVALAAPASGNDRYTVGDFAVEMARVMGLPGDSTESALASLQGRNIHVAGNSQRQLTEGDVVALLSQAGITVTANDPSAPVRGDRGREILSAFSTELSRHGGLVDNTVGANETNPSNPNDDFNNGNGRGGKFKRKKKNSQTGSD
ncbi:MAG TPA: hypothetical protein VJV23_04715 [Candidatus Polarisedimenticolia bacterium]|nr:hypothetical protein [Candidatus Polarisedimenticolia bacterium]